MIEENKIDTEITENPATIKKQLNLKRGRVFIRNLPFTITEEKLRTLFQQHGEVTEVNLPKKEGKDQLKGYGFVQFSTRRDALKSIKELNNTELEGRKIDVSIAKPKQEYQTEKEEEEKLEKKEKPKQNKFYDGRTIFVKNLNFNTDDESLKEFFEKFGKVLSAKIVKNKETGTSKGTGFILLADEEQCESILRIYQKSTQSPDSTNPFELDGRNLVLLSAVTKDKVEEIVQERNNLDKNLDRRNYKLLFYGLNNYKRFKNQEVSEEDQEKRELLIKVKKSEFRKNPNYHISTTRLTIRNLNKKIDEEKLKEIIKNHVNEFIDTLDEEKKGYYNKVKKIKQIKLLRDEKVLDKNGTPKSKCIAFVEVSDNDLGRFLCDSLNNVKIDNASKGLILEFSLEDIRKKIKRERVIKERKTKILEEKKKEKKLKKESKNDIDAIKEISKKENTESIDTIKDLSKLMEIYHSTLSRGKKQRIKKRISKLGFNPETVDFSQKNRNTAYAKKIDDNKLNNYVVKKVDLRQKKRNENQQENGKNMLKQKRERASRSLTKKENFKKKIN